MNLCKKLLCLLLALTLPLCLAGCGVADSLVDATLSMTGADAPGGADSDTGAEAPADAPEAPVEDAEAGTDTPGEADPDTDDSFGGGETAPLGSEGAWAIALVPPRTDELGTPDFLSEDHQKLFDAAMSLYSRITFGMGWDVTGEQVETVDGRVGYRDNGFASYAAFEQALYAVFSTSFVQTNCGLGNMYAEGEDGSLVVVATGGRGSNINYLYTTYAPSTTLERLIEIDMIGHYNEDVVFGEGEYNEAENYTQTYCLTLTLTGSGWRFDTFRLPY